jgi:hypothetical protein
MPNARGNTVIDRIAGIYFTCPSLSLVFLPPGLNMTPRRSALLSLLSILAIDTLAFAHDINGHIARHVELNKRQTTGASFTLQSTNPTAVPLSSINPSEPTKATIPLKSTPTPGSVPSGLTGASGLPDGAFHIFTYHFILILLSQ